MSFDINDNRTEEEIELIALIKRVKEILLKGYIGAEMIGNNIKKDRQTKDQVSAYQCLHGR